MNTPDRPPAPSSEKPVPPRRESREHEADPGLQALVDAESEQSFPASDPPGWTLGLH